MAELATTLDVLLSWRRVGGGATAVMKLAGDTWEEIGRTSSTELTVRGLLQDRSYRFAAAPVDDAGRVAQESAWQFVTVQPLADAGRPATPATPLGLAVAQQGDKLAFQWDAATDGVTTCWELRTGDSWEDARLVAANLTSTTLVWSWWSTGAQTFLLKGADRFGRVCRVAASIAITVAALDTHVARSTTDEAAGGFTGTKTNVEVVGGDLQLKKLPPFGALTVPFGSLTAVGPFARYWRTGTYVSTTVNAGALVPQRLELEVGHTQPVDAGLPFGAMRRPVLRKRLRRDGTPAPLNLRGFGHRTSWRGTPIDPVGLKVEIDTSTTNAGAWDGFRPYVPGTYVCWRFRFRFTLTGDGLRYVKVPSLVLRSRAFNFKDEGSKVLPGGGPAAVNFAAPFTAAPKVNATLSVANAALGVKIEVTNVTSTTCQVEAFDGAGVSIAGTIAWVAAGI